MYFMILPLTAQTKRALVIGISDYNRKDADAWRAIHGANDASLIVPVLKAQGFKTTKICNKNATAAHIRKCLGGLLASCKLGDIIYIHFSCHGQPYEDLDGDEEDGWDESIIPYDALMTYKRGKYEGANHIVDDELHNWYQRIRKKIGSKGLVCIVIDACHAGGSSRGEEDAEDEDQLYVRGTKRGFSPHGKEYRPRINARSHFRIPQEQGLADIAILEACRSYQSNYEIKKEGQYYGPLTYYLSKVLAKQGISHSNKWIKEVQNMMGNDPKLIRQNMVYESSIK